MDGKLVRGFYLGCAGHDWQIMQYIRKIIFLRAKRANCFRFYAIHNQLKWVIQEV